MLKNIGDGGNIINITNITISKIRELKRGEK